MFTSIYEATWEKVNRRSANPPSRVDLDPLLPFDPSIAKAFWSPEFGTNGTLDRSLVLRSERIKSRFFDRRVYPVVPLYVTSHCVEKCVYCNYQVGNRDVDVKRLRLSDGDLMKEVEYLFNEKGFRAIELVYATDPAMRADTIARHVGLVRGFLERNGGGVVGLSAEAMEEGEYRTLKDAGLEFSVVWQETYDRDRYLELHPGKNKKRSFEFRLGSYERMLSAGLSIGMGVLSGLADWRKDWAMLLEHEAYLKRTYGRGPDILGVPRLKPAPGATLQTTAFIPTRQEFLAAVALHNLFAPKTLAFVNTREDWDVCVEMAKGGGCLFTFNCSTIPGGYSLGGDGKQFPSGTYDAPVFAPKLADEGLKPEFGWNLRAIEGFAAARG